MNLSEFKEEFNFKYDAASKGGPDIDDYEMSLMLTQAVKSITELAVSTFETNEESKRIVSAILKYHASSINFIENKGGLIVNRVGLPDKLMAILMEEPKLNNCVSFPSVISCRLDEFNVLINNPFKKPNSRRVLKLELNKGNCLIYSSSELSGYKITYVSEVDPIIIDDLEEGLTIEGLSVKHETILPAFMHDKIVDLAVAKTVKTVRSNFTAQERE
jgi:hypothetical protein